MFALLMIAAGMITGSLVREALIEMRNRRGLYAWPRWVQVLICWSDGIPLDAVGQYPNQQALTDNVWANANPDDLTDYGLMLRAKAREKLGLTD